MLDSLEICRLLEGHGCSLKYKEKAYARGYEHPALEYPLFVKHKAIGAVGLQPLVLHPAYRKSVHWEQIKALTQGAPNENYKSTSLKYFRARSTQPAIQVLRSIVRMMKTCAACSQCLPANRRPSSKVWKMNSA